MKHSDDELGEQIDRLMHSFRRLRARQFWKENVRGGAGFVEVKRAKTGHHWHPHLHVIVDSKYMPQATLRQLWLEITGDSHVVDIRLIRNHQQCIRYVCGYVTKSIDSKLFEDREWLKAALIGLRGRKLCHAFGDWHAWRLTATPDADEWVTLGMLDEWPWMIRTYGERLNGLQAMLPDLRADWTTIEIKCPP